MLSAKNMVLDVDEAMDNMLDDETTLCLDGIVCNNVANFLVHRCHDANLIKIHVQI
jgi:hypothetical protein